MNKSNQPNIKEDLIVSHGQIEHKYGEACNKCKQIMLENPYVLQLLKERDKQLIEKIQKNLDKTWKCFLASLKKNGFEFEE